MKNVSSTQYYVQVILINFLNDIIAFLKVPFVGAPTPELVLGEWHRVSAKELPQDVIQEILGDFCGVIPGNWVIDPEIPKDSRELVFFRKDGSTLNAQRMIFSAQGFFFQRNTKTGRKELPNSQKIIKHLKKKYSVVIV